MRFCLIDQITHLEEGVRIRAVKALSLAEEYLQDHFPRFPVMPGVLMLEAMFQAAAWLVRKTEDFSHAIVELKEAKNVKFQGFVTPGQLLTVTAEILKQDDRSTTLKTQGTVEGKETVSARLVLERFNPADTFPAHDARGRQTREELLNLFNLLYRRPEPQPSTV